MDDESEKQHLSEENLGKLRRVIKTSIAGELTISEQEICCERKRNDSVFFSLKRN